MTTPGWRKKSARFTEIAEAAGVSSATVDRVLNERGSVSQESREKVVAAARRLGIPRVLPDPRHGLIHLDVLLPPDTTPFFRRLNYALQQAIPMLDRRVVVHRIFQPDDRVDAIVRAIQSPPYRRQGLIISTLDALPIRAALRTAIARGEHVVSVMTTFAEVDGISHAGIDNYRAGRTAGYFIGRVARNPGDVLLLCNRHDYRAHADRARGFRDALQEAFPALNCLPNGMETLDDPHRCYMAVAEACRRGNAPVGIYNTGAGSSGVEAALREFLENGNTCWVTHEMTDEHRTYIQQKTLDLVIDQDPDQQIRSALQHLMSACGFGDDIQRGLSPTELRLYLYENVSDASYLPSNA